MIERFLLLAVIIAMSVGICPGQTLPDDSQQYTLFVLTNDVPTVADQALEATLRSPEVAAIAARCKVAKYQPADILYQQRYAGAVPPGAAPAIVLHRPDGGVIYRASGAAIPPPAELAAKLREAATADLAVRSGPIRYTFADEIVAQQLLRRPGILPDKIVVQPTINIPGLSLVMVVGGAVLLISLTIIICRR